MAELAIEHPEQAWLQKPLTDSPDDENVEQCDWHAFYLTAWDHLRYDRFYGAMGGEGPIHYVAISTYARDVGLKGEKFWTFHRVICALDDEWLKHVVERDEVKEKARDNGRR